MIRPRLLLSLCLTLVVTGRPAVAAETPFYLHDGDRVVFYGDSITEQRLYTVFTETFVVTRFPTMRVGFTHSGWGGDKVGGGGGGSIETRLRRDVIAYRPTVVTVMLGMNDASYQPFKQEIFDTYSTGYRRLVDRLREELRDVRLTLIRPSPFDDVTRPPTFEGGYNAVLGRYGDFDATLAKEVGATVADLNAPVVEAMRKAFATDPEGAKKLIPDRVHPELGGQLLMAAALLKAWDAPSLVSSVTINPARATPVDAENATIDGFESKGGGFAWTGLDRALPYPIDLNDAATKLAVASSGFVDDLDRQTIRIVGLKPGDYGLKIDGQEVATYSAGALAAGVNLATVKTPMLAQAKRVQALTIQHNQIHHLRWREVECKLETHSGEDLALALSGLDAIEAKVVDRQRAEARPVSHRFEVMPKG